MVTLRALFLAPLLLIAAPAPACLPPPPGMPEPPLPTAQELAASVVRNSSDIAYGVVISEPAEEPRFKIIHVYKGALHKGQVLRPLLSHAISRQPVTCPGMVPPPPAFEGAYGVIAYSGVPRLAFVEDSVVAAMVASGLIRSARAK